MIVLVVLDDENEGDVISKIRSSGCGTLRLERALPNMLHGALSNIGRFGWQSLPTPQHCKQRTIIVGLMRK